MIGVVAGIDGQTEIDRTPRAEEQRRAHSTQARAVGGQENVGAELVVIIAAQFGQPRRADFFTHFEQQFAVKAETATTCFEDLFQRRNINAVLAFVVGAAASVPAVTFFFQRPWRQITAPVVIVAEHHVAVAIAQYGGQFAVFNARSNQERTVGGMRIFHAEQAETHRRKCRFNLFIEITCQFSVSLIALAFGGNSHPACQCSFVFTLIEPG
ncbi:hypothetical protein SRABI106_04552 [Rahnella aquatilis]|nr:hypothetical protein SRABI106_04552 [Rahnella aquatilis]